MRCSPVILLCTLALAIAGGCQTLKMDSKTYKSAVANQKYDYGEVKRRLKELEPGTTQVEVLIKLGSPAERQRDNWIYLPSRLGLLLPAESLIVRFESGRYASHVFRPVILGERIGG
jgi:hypothetical protein